MTENGSPSSPALWRLLALGGVALILAWGAAEKGPTRWDDSWYLAAAVRLFDDFAADGVAGYWRGFSGALGDKAPLITVLPFPFFCLIGRSVFVIYLVNSVACIWLAANLYRFARRFFNERVSLLAVLFALTSPLLAGLSRIFLVEYWLTALVVASVVALADWDESGRARDLLWLGVLCGFGLLMKVTFPAFVAPVVAVVVWRKHGKSVAQLLADAVLIAAPAAVLAGSWYWKNWQAVTHRSLQETYFLPVHPTESQSMAGMAADYLWSLVNHGLPASLVAAALAGLAVWLLRRRDNFLGGALYYLAPWMITLPVFALSENRDIRLVAPMMPALAIAASALVDLAPARRWVAAGAAAGAVLVTLGHSFEIFGARALRLGRWEIFSSQMSYAFPPNHAPWPLADVIERLAARERLGPGSRLIVGLGADTWSFNSNNLELEAALRKAPIEFHTTAYTSSRTQVRRIMSGTQYYLWKDGGTEKPPSRFAGGPMTIELLTGGWLFREVEPPIPTPDGGRIRFFENAGAGPDAFFPARQSGAAPPPLPPIDLNFGNFLQVTGLDLTEKDGVFTLRTRWRCLNPAPLPYRCFAHIVDPQGRLIQSLDHEILHGSPPVGQWQPGDEGYEARYLALTPAAARGAQLRLGLFHLQTGVRVPLWASTAPLKDGYTAAVIEPNQVPPAGYVFRMQPAPIQDCRIDFAGGLRLTGYSLRRQGEAAWLRLRWEAKRRDSRKLYFFGHAVADQSAETPILFSFDENLALDRMSPGAGGQLRFVQDIVREVSKLGAEAKFLRAGVFDIDQPDDRLAIESGSLPMSKPQKAFYLAIW